MAGKKILIVGEAALLEEYSFLCLQKGLSVSIRANRNEPPLNTVRGIRTIRKLTRGFDIGLELTNVDHVQKKANLIELDKTLPRKIPIISTSVTITAGEQSAWISRPERLVGVAALPSFSSTNLLEFAPSPVSDEAALDGARRLAAMLGKGHAFVKDAVGMVLPRIICSLANEACFAVMEGVAGGKEIDTAMKFGTNYPRGPVEWALEIGPKQIEAVIEALHRFFGEDRYRPSPLLRAAALRNSFSGLL